MLCLAKSVGWVDLCKFIYLREVLSTHSSLYVSVIHIWHSDALKVFSWYVKLISSVTTQFCLLLQLPVSYPSANLKSTIIAYHKRVGNLEAEKYDLEYEVAKKNLEVRNTKAGFLKISGTA